jgi:hypothetical protein
LRLKCDKKRVTKNLVPLDGSKNSFRGIEMPISVERQIGAILAVTYSNQLKVRRKSSI